MADIWNLNGLCRCCHKDGYFRSMQYPYVGKDGEVEVYSGWLKEVFDIIMDTPPIAASIMICEDCIASLRNGRQFKKQVIDCELRFQQYCRNEIKVEPGDNSQLSESQMKLLRDFNFIDGDSPQKDEDLKDRIKKELDIEKQENNPDSNQDHVENCDDNRFDSDSDLEPLIEKKSKKNEKTDTSGKGKVTNNETTKAKVTSNRPKTSNKPKKERKVATKRKSIKTSAKKTTIKRGKDGHTYYRCYKCGLYLNTMLEIKQHMATQHEELEINCKFCEEKIIGILKYKNHVNRNHPGVGIVCKYCSEIYPQGYMLKSHVQKCHPPEDKITYICDYCNKQYLEKHILRGHIRRVHMRMRKHTCALCGLRVFDRSNLNLHIEQVHENVRKFKCELCPNKAYKTSKLLKSHIRLIHTHERPYVCDTCGKSYDALGKLNRHIHNTHYDGDTCTNEVPLGGRIFRCFMCKKGFPSRGAYRKHLNKEHKGMMPYQCHICAKSFASTYVLHRHIFSHETTMKVQCNICLRKFKHEIFLNAHVKRTHGTLHRDGSPRVPKEEYVKCDICHRMVPNIEKHKALHFKRPFKCHLCERDYSMNNALQRHIRETHLGLSFECDICDKKFSKPRSVTRHKQKHHSIEYEREISEKVVKSESDD